MPISVRNWGAVLVAVVLGLAGAPCAPGAPITRIEVSYKSVTDAGPGGNNTELLLLSQGALDNFGPGGPPVPAGVTVSNLELQIFPDDKGHVDLFEPGNAAAKDVTLTEGSETLLFEFTTAPALRIAPGDMLFVDARATLMTSTPHPTLGGNSLDPFVNAQASFLLGIVNTDITYHPGIPPAGPGTPTISFPGTPAAAFILAVPEPASLLAWGVAGAALALGRRHLRRPRVAARVRWVVGSR